MSQDSESKLTTPTTRYQATVIAHTETFPRLDEIGLDVLGRERQRGDGRWAVHTVVTPEQLEPFLCAGATIVLERVFVPRNPEDTVLPDDQAIAEAEKLLKESAEKEAEPKVS